MMKNNFLYIVSALIITMVTNVSFCTTLSNIYSNNFSDTPEIGSTSSSQNLLFIRQKCSNDIITSNTNKFQTNLILNRQMSQAEIGETSGYFLQNKPTPRSFYRNGKSLFFQLPNIEIENRNYIEITKNSNSITFYYMAELSTETLAAINSNCESQMVIDGLQTGRRILLKASIFSSQLGDIDSLYTFFNDKKAGLFELTKNLSLFDESFQERLTIQINWNIQSETFEQTSNWSKRMEEISNSGICFLKSKNNNCDAIINSNIYGFIFLEKDGFLNSFSSSLKNQNSILKYKINDSYIYNPPADLARFYLENYNYNKLIDIFQNNIYYIENFEQDDDLIPSIRNNLKLINNYVTECFSPDISNLEQIEDNCTEAYAEYDRNKKNVELDLSKLTFDQGFFYFCLQDDINSEEYATIQAIKNFLNTNDCFEIKNLFDKISYLDLSGSYISNLKPLLGFINLRKINLNNNYISDYEILEKFNKLIDIDLSSNQITSLYVLKTNHSLERLRLFANLFSETPTQLEDKRKLFKVFDIDSLWLTNHDICSYYNKVQLESSNRALMIFLNKNDMVEIDSVRIPCDLAISKII